MSLKDKVFEADDRPSRDIEVEEWGASVRVRGLSGLAAERFSRLMGTGGDTMPENVMASLLVATIEDPETGELAFGQDDVPALSAKSSRVLTRLFRVAQDLSGLGELEKAKNDSGATQPDGSP
jgi:hypothetical protein